MRVLALETSTLAGGVALVDGEATVGEYTLNVRLTHSERLLSAVDRLLVDAGWGPADLDGIAVAVGPGSFTGLRIGLSTAKGLAFASSLRVAQVPTLDAMAATLPFAALPVCPVLDARRDEVYASRYRWDGTAMVREWDYLAVTPAELAARLDEPVILLGHPVAAIPSPLARLAPPQRRLPSAASVGHLGLRMLERGEGVAAADLAPLYLRAPAAEIRRRVVAAH
jgi:tRNA threonylcarbamoyladenosine biosynthesis protein TsaB